MVPPVTRRRGAPWLAHIICLLAIALPVGAFGVLMVVIGGGAPGLAALGVLVGAVYLAGLVAYHVVSTVLVLFMRRSWQPVVMHLVAVTGVFLLPGWRRGWQERKAHGAAEEMADQVRGCFHLTRWSESWKPRGVHVTVEGTADVPGEVELLVDDLQDPHGNRIRFGPAFATAAVGEPVVLESEAEFEAPPDPAYRSHEFEVRCQGGIHLYQRTVLVDHGVAGNGAYVISHPLPEPSEN